MSPTAAQPPVTTVQPPVVIQKPKPTLPKIAPRAIVDKEYAVIETITPNKAAEYLQFNYVDNRKIRPSHLNSLISDFKQGRIFLTNDAICFDKEGTLINGQHRLQACVATGITFQAIVLYNLDPETYYVIDRGSPRRPADILHVSTKVTAIINFWITLAGSKSKSIIDMRTIYEKYTEAIHFALENCPMNTRGLSKAVLLATVARAYICNVDRKRLTEFCRFLVDPTGTKPEDNGAIKAYRFLMENRASGTSSYVEHYECISYCLDKFLKRQHVTAVRGFDIKYDPFPIELPM